MKELILYTVLLCQLGFCRGAVFSDRLLGKKASDIKNSGISIKIKDKISKRQFIPPMPNYEPQVQYPYIPQQNMWQSVNVWPQENAGQYDLQKAIIPSSELNIPETDQNAAAAYKGLSYYIGSTVNRKADFPPGFPVALEVDKEKSNFEEEEMKLSAQSIKSQKGLGRAEIVANLTTIVDFGNSHEDSTTPQTTTQPSTTTSTTKTTTTTTATTTTATTKSSNEEHSTDESIGVKGTVCYLPRIVVTTRLVGYTVLNEVKIYTNPRDENSVHSFVSSHEVSDAASKVTHEFALPPEFIVEKPISKADMKYYNKVPVMLTSARIEGNHGGYPLCNGEPCRRSEESFGPTFNPFLPTSKIRAKLTSTTTSTTTIPKTTSTTPTKSSTSKVLKAVEKSSFTETKLFNTADSKKRVGIEQLNYVARHRNALFDVPGGDSAAFSGYQILGPPDVQQVWVKTSAKK